jgi:hypothetical protein
VRLAVSTRGLTLLLPEETAHACSVRRALSGLVQAQAAATHLLAHLPQLAQHGGRDAPFFVRASVRAAPPRTHLCSA